MNENIQLNNLNSAKVNYGEDQFSKLKKIDGLYAKCLAFFGRAIKVENPDTNSSYYLRLNDLVQGIVGDNENIGNLGRKDIARAILEIVKPDTRKAATESKVHDLFLHYFDNSKYRSYPKSSSFITGELEKMKMFMSDVPPMFFKDNLKEIVKDLKPGDIFFKRVHHSHFNPVVVGQGVLRVSGDREAYKLSHQFIYLGEVNGEYWIAESTTPHEGEAELRRIRIDDPRLKLEPKDQYVVLRRKDEEIAKKSAEIAKNYCLKIDPEEGIYGGEVEGSVKYAFVHAIRSIWHSSNLGYFGKLRLVRYYTDLKNGCPFTYLGEKRGFFCSHFATIVQTLAELDGNKEFKEFLDKENMPKKDSNEGGVGKPDLWYSLRKGVWSHWMVIKHYTKLGEFVKTKLDAFRTTPQDSLIYMMDHSEDYTPVGVITRVGDYYSDSPSTL